MRSRPYLSALLSSVSLCSQVLGQTPSTFVNGQNLPAPSLNNAFASKMDVVSVLTSGAVCNGVTDDSTAINAAIVTASASGGVVQTPPGRTCAVASIINLKSNVVLSLSVNSTLKWTGSSSGTMFTSDGTSSTALGVIGTPSGIGSYILPPATGTAFLIPVCSFCEFGGLVVTGPTTTLFDLRSNASGNTVKNSIHDLGSISTIGTVIKTTGRSDGTSSTVVTENTISRLNFDAVSVCGICFVQWTDNNWLYDVRVSLNANNAAGVIFNSSGTPTSDLGVYANTFNNLAVDTFNSMSGRSGVILNKTKEVVINAYFQDPTAENGAIVNNNGDSFQIQQIGNPSISGDVTIRNKSLNAIFQSTGGFTFQGPSITLNGTASPGPNYLLNGSTTWIGTFANFAQATSGFYWATGQPFQWAISSAPDATGYLGLMNFTSDGTNIQIATVSNNMQLGNGSVGTAATTGFIQIPTVSGAPTGNCGGASGKACIVIDTTNKKFCYNASGTTWECSPAFTP